MGVIFHASGSCSHARKDLYKRGLKAIFKLNSNFSDMAPGIKTIIHLFDHTVKPIILYGSEMWGDATLKINLKLTRSYKFMINLIVKNLT